jgi:hypothetical protein
MNRVVAIVQRTRISFGFRKRVPAATARVITRPSVLPYAFDASDVGDIA